MAVHTLVIDANIVISALFKDSFTRRFLLMTRKPEMFAPEFIMEELSKYLPEFSERMGITESGLSTSLQQLFKVSEIKVVPKDEYAGYMEKALAISPDVKDAPYIALALKTHSAIWSQDKHFKKQKQVKVYTTNELLEKLTHKEPNNTGTHQKNL